MVKEPNTVIFIKGLDLGGYSGGADLFGANLACALHGDGQQAVLYICYKFNTDTERNILKSIREKGITPIFLLNWSGHASVLSYLQAFWKFNTHLKYLKTDIIHSHFHTGTLLSLFLKLFGRVRRVVRTAHVDHEWKRGWNGIVKQSIIRTMIFVLFPLLIDLEVGVSTYTVEVLNQRLIARILKKRALMIPNAIPPHDGFERLMPQTRFSGWLGNHPIIGSVGRLEEQKGYIYLITALPEILSVFPDLETWLIGDGPLMSELKTQCQTLGIADKVVFWGKQNNVHSLLSRMDLFVSSSLYEGLPTVVLEAMDMGIPCVVTDIPGTRDIVSSENGLLVEAMSSRALAKAILSALGTPSVRKTLVENGLRTVDRFRIDIISRAYLAEYQKL